MKKSAMVLAIIAGMGTAKLSQASIPEHIAAMESRVNYLEQRVQSQDFMINQTRQRTRGWMESLEIAGLLEVEEGSRSGGSDDQSNITTATVELALTAGINQWTRADIVLLYEDSGDTELDVDTATISLANPNSNWSLTAGHTAIPFGVYDSKLVSDPLTLELGETFEDILQFELENGDFSGGIYVFNGDIDDGEDDVASYGAYVNYQTESPDSAFGVSLGYLNNIGDSDGLSALNEDGGDINDHVAGVYVAMNYSLGSLSFIGEYLGASDIFSANALAGGSAAASPSATNLELAYNFGLSGKEITLAMSVQGTREARDTGLPENKTLLDISIGVMENMSVAFEYANEEDYAGDENNAFTAQLAVEF